jgi:hypothetical protein
MLVAAHALSWLNFFLSGMQTAFGPIAAAYPKTCTEAETGSDYRSGLLSLATTVVFLSGWMA